MALSRTRKIALASLIGVGALAGSAGLANAVLNPSPSTTAPDPGEANVTSDMHEDAALAKLAKVDLGDAAAAATKAVPGTAIEAELDDEGGKPVFEVDVVTDKGTVEVTVDGTNGQVITQHLDQEDDD